MGMRMRGSMENKMKRDSRERCQITYKERSQESTNVTAEQSNKGGALSVHSVPPRPVHHQAYVKEFPYDHAQSATEEEEEADQVGYLEKKDAENASTELLAEESTSNLSDAHKRHMIQTLQALLYV